MTNRKLNLAPRLVSTAITLAVLALMEQAAAQTATPPTDSADSAAKLQRVEITGSLIKRVAANRTVLMVEHNLSVVANLCDHITVLARRQIIAEGNYESVSKNPCVIQAYLGSEHA